MTKLFYIFLISVFSVVISSCSSEDTSSEPLNMVATFEIEGMVCVHGCKSVIEKEMRKTQGITAFNIDFENVTAEVFFDKNIITSEAIIKEVATINDGIYNMKLIKEHKQMNAVEALPSEKTSSPVSVSNFSFQVPNITHFIAEWIRI